ncbi:citrate synthase, putative [Eimeria acervulina]|uniref:Citrate synthase n=1 Tax=Eimeria acervulina TaxID=5801 RepID=U6GHG0_EIMAC|nr:citrate synthase, putative [Eimeria acervulina]CDI79696.1 citrate synthase, putative [Eimeria acervulina]
MMTYAVGMDGSMRWLSEGVFVTMSPSVPYSVSLNSVPTRHTERAGTYSERSPDAQPSKESSKTPSSGGLAGVVAGESSICTVALGSGLNYRGYNVVDLAREATFEEVVHLLLLGELPNQQQLVTLKKKLYEARQLPPPLLAVLRQIPKEAHPMDVLRTTCSVVGTLEPEINPPQQQVDVCFAAQPSPEIRFLQSVLIAIRLIGCFGGALNYWYHFANSGKEISLASDPEDSVATNFLKLLNGDPAFTPHPIVAKTLDTSLILYAEHDFNASTFACRVTAGTRSDLYSCICSGIGTLKGPLHGGANQAALEMLLPLASIEEAKQRLEEAFAHREVIMGFGHRMYKHGDPRAPLMRRLAEALAAAQLPDSDPEMVRIGAFIEEHMLRRKNMHANVDFSAAIAYKQSD